MAHFRFSRTADRIFRAALLVPPLLILLGGAAFSYFGTNDNLEVGYSPRQPVPFSHKLHAGDLGLDCRYCHLGVEKTREATIPATEICMNCHAKVRTESPALLPVRESFASGNPIPWKRVHKLADYAYFDHRAHVTAGVACAKCHGRVDQMDVVRQVAPLSMGFCLECHRNPEPNLTSPRDVTRMSGLAALSPSVAPAEPPRAVTPPVHCSGCHR